MSSSCSSLYLQPTWRDLIRRLTSFDPACFFLCSRKQKRRGCKNFIATSVLIYLNLSSLKTRVRRAPPPGGRPQERLCPPRRASILTLLDARSWRKFQTEFDLIDSLFLFSEQHALDHPGVRLQPVRQDGSFSAGLHLTNKNHGTL